MPLVTACKVLGPVSAAASPKLRPQLAADYARKTDNSSPQQHQAARLRNSGHIRVSVDVERLRANGSHDARLRQRRSIVLIPEHAADGSSNTVLQAQPVGPSSQRDAHATRGRGVNVVEAKTAARAE